MFKFQDFLLFIWKCPLDILVSLLIIIITLFDLNKISPFLIFYLEFNHFITILHIIQINQPILIYFLINYAVKNIYQCLGPNN